MEAIISAEYKKTIEDIEEVLLDMDGFEDYVKNDYYGGGVNIEDTEDLVYALRNYTVNDPGNISCEMAAIHDELLSAVLLNEMELIEEFKYLIKEEEVTCCKGKTTNFCPTCGKKLW